MRLILIGIFCVVVQIGFAVVISNWVGQVGFEVEVALLKMVAEFTTEGLAEFEIKEGELLLLPLWLAKLFTDCHVDWKF